MLLPHPFLFLVPLFSPSLYQKDAESLPVSGQEDNEVPSKTGSPRQPKDEEVQAPASPPRPASEGCTEQIATKDAAFALEDVVKKEMCLLYSLCSLQTLSFWRGGGGGGITLLISSGRPHETCRRWCGCFESLSQAPTIISIRWVRKEKQVRALIRLRQMTQIPPLFSLSLSSF